MTAQCVKTGFKSLSAHEKNPPPPPISKLRFDVLFVPVATIKTRERAGARMRKVSRGRSELFRCSCGIVAGSIPGSNTVVLEQEWINEFGGAQIVEDKKLTEARIKCVLVWANTNTHSTSLADSAVLGRCQGDVHLRLMFSLVGAET